MEIDKKQREILELLVEKNGALVRINSEWILTRRSNEGACSLEVMSEEFMIGMFSKALLIEMFIQPTRNNAPFWAGFRMYAYVGTIGKDILDGKL